MQQREDIIVNFIFGFILIASFCLIVYSLRYNVAIDHDLIYGYGRTILDPEHGRYVATAINVFFSEQLPYFLNIHPNDFIPMVMGPVKAVVVIFFCLVFANTFFIFQKEEKDILKFDFGNYAYLLTYIITFLAFYNCNYFFNAEYQFFSIQQSTVFWEYPCSLFYYVIFFNLFGYYYINKKVPTGKNWIILIIFTFLLGLSIEPVNAPVLFTLTIFFIIFLFNIRKFDKISKIKAISLYIVYLISITIYYLHPNDSTTVYGDNGFKYYILTEIENYMKVYLNQILINISYILIPTIIILFLTSIKKGSDKNILYIAILNILSLLIFYLAVFVLGFDNIENGTYFVSYPKWHYLYKVMALYTGVFCIGYYIDKCIRNEKKTVIKASVVVIIILIFIKPLIIDYKQDLNNWIKENQRYRKTSYIIEKLVISNENSEDIILPKAFDNNDNFMLLDSNNGKTFLKFLQFLHYPELQNKKKIVFDENYIIDDNLFTEEELEELKFQKLLKHRIHKNEVLGYKYWFDPDYWE